MEIRFWLWKYAFLVTLGYGRDESVPYAWRGVSQPISWVFVTHHGMFVTH
nr:hypothetical protein [Prevotella pallens]